jgi:hypothetical protein
MRFLFLFLSLFNLCFSNQTGIDETIVIGGSFNKNKVSDNSEYSRGFISFFNNVINSKKDVQPQVIFYDNSGNSKKNISNISSLIYVDKMKILCSIDMFEDLSSLHDIVEKKNIKIFNPIVSFPENILKEYDIETIIPTLEEDINKLSEVTDIVECKKIAVIYQKKREYEKNILSRILDQKTEVTVKYCEYDENISNEEFLEIKNLSPDLIFIFGDLKNTLNFMKKSHFTSLSKATFALPFNAFGSSIIKSLKNYYLNIYITKVFPNIDSKDSITEEFEKIYIEEKNIFKGSESALYGYICAKAIYEKIINGTDLRDYLIKEKIYDHRIEKLFNK